MRGWITEHLPLGTEIVEHDGELEIGTEIETGTKAHRFLFEDMEELTITYRTNQPVNEANYYWVSYDGSSHFGWHDNDSHFSTE